MNRKNESLFVVLMFFTAVFLGGCEEGAKKTSRSPVGAVPARRTGEQMIRSVGESIDPAKLQIFPGDRVWVVDMKGDKESDPKFRNALESAIADALKTKGKCIVVGKGSAAVTKLFAQHAKGKTLELKTEQLLSVAKSLKADKILTYRVLKIEKKRVSVLEKALQAAMFNMTPGQLDRIKPALHVMVIDVATGTNIAGGMIEEKRAETVFYDTSYPMRTAPPERSGRYPPPPKKPKVSSVLKTGRAYRAYVKMSNDLGPHGLYKNEDWDNFSRFSNELGPSTLYSSTDGQCVITTTPSKAWVFVNGQVVGKTPLYWSFAPKDKVVIYKEGYIREEFEAPFDDYAFHINLRPR